MFNHKHFGLTFSANAKLTDHIREIYTNACKRFNNYHETSKNKIHRHSSEKKIYIGFIIPILEYGNIIWDNLSLEESELIV